MGSNAPLLYEYALVGDWESLMRRIVTHPREASYKDKCKNTPLHVSCRRQPPPEVVEALLNANPDALTSKTVDGMTPLHFCCFCGSEPSTIDKVLLLPNYDHDTIRHHYHQEDDNPTTLRELVDRRGRTPLHCVCAGFRSKHRLDVVRMLLELDPSCAITPDERGRTPLSLIVDDYAEELQDALRDTVTPEQALAKCQPDQDLHECFQAGTLLLRAAYTGTIEEDPPLLTNNNEVRVQGPFRLLHAAVGITGCPSVLIRLLLKTDPEAVSKRDGDLNLPLHKACKTVGQPWSRKIIVTKPGAPRGSVVYNADFGRRPQHNTATTTTTTMATTIHTRSTLSPNHTEDDDVTQELIEAYPEAASVADESGKVPFVLAVESGKPWKTTLEPLWKAHDLEDESYQLLQEALDRCLTSVSPTLRKRTVSTLECLAPLWPLERRRNDWILHLIEFTRDCGGLNSATTTTNNRKDTGNNNDDDDDDAWHASLQASTLEGLASVLASVKDEETLPKHHQQQALDVALPLLYNPKEAVRIGAARVLGAAVAMLGTEATERAFRDVIFPSDDSATDDDDTSLSTIGHSVVTGVGEEATVEVIHGRAMACRNVLEMQFRVLTESQTLVVKEEWMRHESPLVRRAGCWVVGSVLRSTVDLRAYRSSLLKCMRATEDSRVQWTLGHALSHAASRHDRLFLCRAGLPLLDGALMLSCSRATPPHVQQVFDMFLWHALQRQESGLQEYMKMAEGENGRTMMGLVTKRLGKLPAVAEEEEEGGGGHEEKQDGRPCTIIPTPIQQQRPSSSLPKR